MRKETTEKKHCANDRNTKHILTHGHAHGQAAKPVIESKAEITVSDDQITQYVQQE